MSRHHGAGGGGIVDGALVHGPAQGIGLGELGPEKLAQVTLFRGGGRDGSNGVRVSLI